MSVKSAQSHANEYRPVSIGSYSMKHEQDAAGNWILTSEEPLGDYPQRLFDCLISGASAYPDRIFMAERGSESEWIHLSYAEMYARVRCIGQALLDRGLSPDRPVLIMSGNDLAHIQLALASMLAGAAYCPLSPAYSLHTSNPEKLVHMVQLLTPGLVFASDGDAFEQAIRTVIPAKTEVVLLRGSLKDRKVTYFDELLRTPPSTIDQQSETIAPDAIAKFLFTSGSTKLPKAVPCTHRMLCSNQQMLRQAMPVFAEEPPVIVDWLPWNHTFGGSHNVGIALYNGGSYYIDDGKPTSKDFVKTIRNLKSVAPTVLFNVPKGWELLTEALESEPDLRDSFFSKIKLFFFAGAGLSQAAWDRLESVTKTYCGQKIRIMAGLGMTETAPSCTFTTSAIMQAGYVGIPAPGVTVKLTPKNGKLEARFRGPNVMPAYWRNPEQTAEAFDEDGFYCSGDAVCFVDAANPSLGLMFDGRITEDFKLSTGTFVSVGPMRARIISSGAPYVQDVVVTGLNRDDIGIMIFPRLESCQKLAQLAHYDHPSQVLNHPAVQRYFSHLLTELNQAATGSASRIARMCLLEEPPSIDHAEITDKGSINQRAVLDRRAQIVDALHNSTLPVMFLAG